MRRKWFRRKTPVQCRFSSTLMSLKTCGLRKLSGFFEYLTFRGPSCLVRLFIDHIENAVKIYISSDAISEIFFWQRSICIRLLVTGTIKMGMKIFKTWNDFMVCWIEWGILKLCRDRKPILAPSQDTLNTIQRLPDSGEPLKTLA